MADLSQKMEAFGINKDAMERDYVVCALGARWNPMGVTGAAGVVFCG